MEAILPYLGGLAAVLSLVAAVSMFAVRAEVRQAKAATDLAIANAVRERIEALALLRQWASETFAGKESISSWMRELKADMDGRFNRIEAKIDRLGERHGTGHDD